MRGNRLKHKKPIKDLIFNVISREINGSNSEKPNNSDSGLLNIYMKDKFNYTPYLIKDDIEASGIEENFISSIAWAIELISDNIDNKNYVTNSNLSPTKNDKKSWGGTLPHDLMRRSINNITNSIKTTP